MAKKWIQYILVSVVLSNPTYAQFVLYSYSIGFCSQIGYPVDPPFFKKYYMPQRGIGMELRFNFTLKTSMAFQTLYQPFHLNAKKIQQASEKATGEKWTHVRLGTIRMDMYSLSIVRHFTSPEHLLTLYGTLSGGIYRIDPDDIGIRIETEEGVSEETFIRNGEEEYKPAMDIGLGLDIGMYRRISGFLEMKYHRIFTSPKIDPLTQERQSGGTAFWSSGIGIRFNM